MTDGRVESYLDIYRLRITKFWHTMLDDDQIIEPGETGMIHTVQIENVGKMPSPSF